MERHDVHELTAAYALDALDPHDEVQFEEHLSGCERCREELAALRETAALLAYGAGPATPPPALRNRILEGARAERPNVVPLRPRWALPAAVSAAAAAAAVAIGLGVWGSSVSSELERERDARVDEDQALAVALDPNADHFRMQGGEGTLVVSEGGQAALVLVGLDPPPEGQVYAAWVSEDGERMLPAGTFEAGAERSVVGLTQRVPAGGVVAVTLERDASPDEPSSTPLMVAETT